MYRDPDSREKRWSGGVLVLAAIGALTLIAALAFVALVIASMSFFQTSTGQRSDEFKYLEHRSFSAALAEIKLDAALDSEVAASVVKKFSEAAQDERIEGVLFEINSPGGSVVASQEIFDTIMSVRQKLPVVSYFREVAASGAYYASVPSSWIVANRGTMVGSIGVMMSSFEAVRLMDWMKINPVTLKTGRLKDSGSQLRSWTPEDKEYLQKLIDDTREQFAGDVRAARPQIPAETMQHMSDGRVVLGTEALQRKLVDSLGSRRDAVAKAAELAGLTTGADTKVIPMEEPEFRSFLAELLGNSAGTVINSALRRFTEQNSALLNLQSTPKLEAK